MGNILQHILNTKQRKHKCVKRELSSVKSQEKKLSKWLPSLNIVHSNLLTELLMHCLKIKIIDSILVTNLELGKFLPASHLILLMILLYQNLFMFGRVKLSVLNFLKGLQSLE